MIDPMNITKYDRTQIELEEFILFCILVAGKRASHIAKALHKILDAYAPSVVFMTPNGPKKNIINDSPFGIFRKILSTYGNLNYILKQYGIGCYNIKSRSLSELVYSDIDLYNCEIEDLLQIYGIGPKTANFFILHSRPNVRCAVLDTHILSWLRSQGCPVPDHTPGNYTQYNRIAEMFLVRVPYNKTVAEFDLEIWRQSQNKKGIYEAAQTS